MKKTLTLLLLAAMLTAPLAGCGTTDDTPAETTDGKGNSTTASTTAVPPDDPGNDTPAEPNPASDFEYSVGTDYVTITKYIGTATTVVIPDKIEGKDVTRIREYAFAHNKKLVSIDIADSITIIEQTVFEDCSSLKKVDLPQNLQQLEYGAFLNCESLETITLPSSIKKIGSEAFQNCIALKQINIPGSITDFGSNIFAKSGLETVTIQEGLEIITSGTFQETNIKEIVLPSSVRAIHSLAFAYCANLESVILNNGIEYIDNSVFGGCPKLKEITIPSSVESMNEFALYKCGLEKVYFEGNAPDNFIESFRRMEDLSFTIYYHEGAKGFTTPEWMGYKTEIW